MVDSHFDLGKLEGKKEIARNLINLGMTLELISEATGLTVDDLKLIKSKKD